MASEIMLIMFIALTCGLGVLRWRYAYHAAAIIGGIVGIIIVCKLKEPCLFVGAVPEFLIIAAVGELIGLVSVAVANGVRRTLQKAGLMSVPEAGEEGLEPTLQVRVNPPILDYAAATPRTLGERCIKRIGLAVLIFGALYTAPLAWLYWGWNQEQPAREMLTRIDGAIDGTESAEPGIVPARIRERITGVALPKSATAEDIRTLGCLTRLRKLRLVRCSDEGLAYVAGFGALEELTLKGPLTDAGLAHLEGVGGLRVLSLTDTQITDAGLVHLERLTRLEVLVFDGARVTDSGLAQLKACTGLRVLGLYGARITDAGLTQLKGLDKLQSLWLDRTAVTDVGLAHLKEFTALQAVSLAGTQITDAGLAHLSGLSGLQKLLLSDTQITDAGAVHLKGLAGLQVLCLEGTHVTNDGLAQLSGMKGLAILYLARTQVTNERVADLQKSLPNCRIFR